MAEGIPPLHWDLASLKKVDAFGRSCLIFDRVASAHKPFQRIDFYFNQARISRGVKAQRSQLLT